MQIYHVQINEIIGLEIINSRQAIRNGISNDKQIPTFHIRIHIINVKYDHFIPIILYTHTHTPIHTYIYAWD